jgi:hypothetical protein
MFFARKLFSTPSIIHQDPQFASICGNLALAALAREPHTQEPLSTWVTFNEKIGLFRDPQHPENERAAFRVIASTLAELSVSEALRNGTEGVAHNIARHRLAVEELILAAEAGRMARIGFTTAKEFVREEKLAISKALTNMTSTK